MKFEEPKVEFLRIDSTEVVFSSNHGAGGTQTCVESGGTCSVEAMLDDY